MSFKTLPMALMLGAAMTCLSLTGCESPAGKVSVLAGDTSQLTVGSTYAWAPVLEPGAGDPRVSNTIMDERIRNGINSALAAKGYKLTDASSAQFLVSYHIGLKEGTDYRVDSMGYGGGACGIRGCIGGYGWGAYGAPTDVTAINYTEGTLMLDLVNTSSGKLTWRGISRKRVDDKDADQAKINAMMLDLTKDLPGNVTTQ